MLSLGSTGMVKDGYIAIEYWDVPGVSLILSLTSSMAVHGRDIRDQIRKSVNAVQIKIDGRYDKKKKPEPSGRQNSGNPSIKPQTTKRRGRCKGCCRMTVMLIMDIQQQKTVKQFTKTALYLSFIVFKPLLFC